MLGRKGKSLLFVYLLIDFIHQFIIEKEWTYFKTEKKHNKRDIWTNLNQ